tara:strand:+ start:60 stop:935 length:876 start_codon:yes stop_codon:yes gene_type:complete
LILNIFRISAIFALIGVGVYYFLNLESFTSLEGSLSKAIKNEQNSSLQLEVDKNKSEALITDLYRERSKMRQSIEDLENNIEKLGKDIELIEPLMEKIKGEINIIDDELLLVSGELKQSELPLESILKENETVFQRHTDLLELHRKSLEVLESLRKQADSLVGDLTALSKERQVAQSNFSSQREEILLELKHPGHLYYGDETEVSVSSKAPSGKGVFIDQGRENGFRENMLFTVKKTPFPEEIPFILRTTIVEDEFSFLEFIELGSSSKSLNVEDGEKLFLIRTGDSNTSN